MPRRRYILDANVFIEAKNTYYGFDICPGFWRLLEHHGGTKVVSLQPIRDELLRFGDGEEPLVIWTRGAPDNFFRTHHEAAVASEYAAMMAWVEGNTQFNRAAKTKFAQEADCWLPAFAKAKAAEADWVVVTHEQFAPDSVKKVPLPNVCRQFGVTHMNTVEMMRALPAQLHWTS